MDRRSFLGAASLYEGRDLKPTLALDHLLASVCAETFGLELDSAARTLFADSVRAPSMHKLLRV